MSSAPHFLVTRSPSKAQALVGELLRLVPEATVDCAPIQQAVYCAPVGVEPSDFDSAQVTFSSANGVAGLAFWADSRGTTLARLLAQAQVASVGAATATALKKHGVTVHFQPSTADAAHLAAELELTGQPIITVLGRTARPHLVRDLGARGAEVKTAVVYDMADYPAENPLVEETEVPGLPAVPLETARERLAAYTAVAATAPSLLKKLTAGIAPEQVPPIVAIGETTAATARELGLRVTVSASPTPKDLAEALAKNLERNTHEKS